MKELELTRERYTKIWLAYFWRVATGGVIVFLILRIFERIIGLEAALRVHSLLSLIEGICGIAISYTVLKWALLASFKEFRVVLVQREPVQSPAEAAV